MPSVHRALGLIHSTREEGGQDGREAASFQLNKLSDFSLLLSTNILTQVCYCEHLILLVSTKPENKHILLIQDVFHVYVSLCVHTFVCAFLLEVRREHWLAWSWGQKQL